MELPQIPDRHRTASALALVAVLRSSPIGPRSRLRWRAAAGLVSAGGCRGRPRSVPGRSAWFNLGRLRLRWTGLWLLFFAATHLVNHALGLVSLRAAESGRLVFLAFWRSPPIEASLAADFSCTCALGLWQAVASGARCGCLWSRPRSLSWAV